MSRPEFLVSALCLLAAFARGQPTGHVPPMEAVAPNETHAPSEETAAPTLEPGSSAWEFSISASVYAVPGERDYVQPTITADIDWLHLEARYNYEDLDTGSLWAGYNFSGGDELAWAITPMLGAVFGRTEGVAPGYEITLSWRKLELYSEGEYVVNTDDSSESFFYSWSTLTLAPVEWFYFGLVGQRTKVRGGEREYEPGVIVGFIIDKVDLSAFVLNPEDDDPTFVFSFGVSF